MIDVRFWAKVVEAESGCWEWIGYRNSAGYGRLTRDKRTHYAHRFAYELLVGPIPDGLHLDHLCRNPPCVNPDHLDPVTPLENSLRSPVANAGKPACPQGHPYSDENTERYAGRRRCVQCRRKAVREYAARRRAKLRDAAQVT